MQSNFYTITEYAPSICHNKEAQEVHPELFTEYIFLNICSDPVYKALLQEHQDSRLAPGTTS